MNGLNNSYLFWNRKMDKNSEVIKPCDGEMVLTPRTQTVFYPEEKLRLKFGYRHEENIQIRFNKEFQTITLSLYDVTRTVYIKDISFEEFVSWVKNKITE